MSGQDAYVKLQPYILNLTDLSLTDKAILSYINGFDNAGLEFFVHNKNIAETFSISVSTVSATIKKLKQIGFIKSRASKGRERTITGTLMLKNLRAGYQNSEDSLPKSASQPTKIKDHIYKNNSKSKSKLKSSSYNEKNSFYTEEIILNLICDKIENPNLYHVSIITNRFLKGCREAFLSSESGKGSEWDNNSYKDLPYLIYQLCKNFIPEENRKQNLGILQTGVIEIFEILLAEPSRWTNTISSYSRVYNYWIDEKKKTNSWERINRILSYNLNTDQDDFI